MVSKAFGATVRNSLATLSAIGLILPMPSIAIAQARGATQTESLADLVNPLMGTDSDYTLSYGNMSLPLNSLTVPHWLTG